MPKYRFVTDNGAETIRDDKFTDLPDDQSAVVEAQRGLADLAKASLPNGSHAVFRVVVENEFEDVIYQVSMELKGEDPKIIRLEKQEKRESGD